MDIDIFKTEQTRSAFQEIKIILFLFYLLFFQISCPAFADSADLGWIDIKADPVTHEETVKTLTSRTKGQQITRIGLKEDASRSTGNSPAISADTAGSMLADLAHGLQNDPAHIFDYVHNHIEYVPYFGALKGAALTMLDGSGNDFDQAALMIALLRHAGYTARFVYGTMSISYEDLSNWLGVENDWKRVGNFLASGGIPVSESDDAARALVDRVWVEATIDNEQYLFDPAWKTYTEIPGIDVGQAMGYDRESFLNSVTEGATITETYTQNLNTANLATELESYTTNLANRVQSKHPNAKVEEIIGGRAVQQSQLADYPTSLPFPTSNERYWDEVPDAYTTTIRIRHMGIDVTCITPDIAGKRLIVTYDADNRPTLQLDGTVFATGDAVTTDDWHDLEIFVDHPYSHLDGHYADEGASNDSSFCDPSTGCLPPYRVKRNTTCALITAFGDTSNDLLDFRQQQLNKSLESGHPEGSEPVLGETLNIIGLTWMQETSQTTSLLAELAQVRSTTHHRMGVMCQDEGYSIDVKLQTSSTFSRADTGPSGYFYAKNLMQSGFEHGVLEQLVGADRPAASTIKLLHIANTSGEPVYWATGATYDSIKDSLQNYSQSDLNRFQNQVDAGHVLVLPRQGNLTLEEWTGKGYIDFMESDNFKSLGMIIGGGYHGGYSGSPGQVNPQGVNDATQNSANTDQNMDTTPPVTSAEPVDMASGAYLYEHTDLVLGSNATAPLRFHRSYTSGRRLQKFANNGFGYGWTHNYNIRLQETSDGNPSLGQRTPSDMAPMIAASRASLDLLKMKNEQTIQSWMVCSLTAKWAIDQLIDNVITVHAGNKNIQFVKLPNGVYVAPPGITAMLSKSDDGGYILQERFGNKMNFEKGPGKGYRISSFQDIDNNRIDFTYTNDKLTEVANTFGHTLSLNYTGDSIGSISDSTGRTVLYSYTENDLTSFIDPDGKESFYEYDAGHRMTSLQNPLNITTAINTYNSRNQVIHQSVPRQNGEQVTYNFYFSGYRNVEEDPDRHCLVSYFDRKGRVVGRQNKLGHRINLTYDGQDHIVAVTDSRGFSTTFTYDGNHNLIGSTDPLGLETTFGYDDQFRLTNIIDPLGQRASRDYDSKHHLIAKSVYPQDGQPVTRETVYHPNGLPAQVTDGRGIITSLTYDEHGNPVSSQVADGQPVFTDFDEAGRLLSLTDRENNTTNFQYNGRGLLTVETDPFGLSSEYSYNDDATLHTHTDRNGDTTTYAYTVTGKVASVTYQDGSTVQFGYDRHDLPVTMTDALGTTSYTRDQAGRITAVTDANGNTVGYSYDENGYTGLLTTVTYPDDKQVTYTYDEMNRLTGVTNWLGQTATYTYDEAGRLISLVNFNGTVTTYSYDGANRLVSSVAHSSQDAEIASFLYTLDGNGNRVRIEKQIPLVASLPLRNQNAEYQNNRLTRTDTAFYNHDNQGRLASKEQDGTTISYTYNGAHQLTAINGDLTFQYDGIGNRLRAVRDGVATHYIYDIGGNLIGEADGDNNIIRCYIYGAGLLASISATDDVFCYHYDGIGSTVAITDEAANVVNAYAYSPFGLILDESETFAQPFKYVGQYGVMAEPQGLYYMRARYYDPDTGRFISEDPIGFGGGDVNLYGYVQNNPVNWVDPYGLWTLQIGLGINFGLGLGGTSSWGIAISSDPCTGEKGIGLYSTKGFGIEAGGVLEGAIDVTWSPNNKIEDLSGLGFTLGGSAGTPLAHLGVGGEGTFPIGSSPSWTGSATFGLSALGGEAHGFITSTNVIPLGKWK